jgi:isochorismate synthase
LATTVTVDLRAPSPSALHLAAALHPTPAVCGRPTDDARRVIGQLESMERGWYSGAVGWMDGHGDGEFVVAIRCGLFGQDNARLYAGAGVVRDSDPAGELRETEGKLQALLVALERPVASDRRHAPLSV